jgi:hypothetical protein
MRDITQEELGKILGEVQIDYPPNAPASEIIPVIANRVINLVENN